MLSLDTNCLLRWLLGDVPAQADQVAELLARPSRYDVADVALVEVVFVLEKQLLLSRPAVAASVDQLVSQPNLVFDKVLWSGIMETYLKRPKLSAVDIYLAARARAHADGTLLTFDQKLASQEAGVRLLLTDHPA